MAGALTQLQGDTRADSLSGLERVSSPVSHLVAITSFPATAWQSFAG